MHPKGTGRRVISEDPYEAAPEQSDLGLHCLSRSVLNLAIIMVKKQSLL